MKTELLLQQTADAYEWTNTLLDLLPYEHWPTLPPVLKTNVLWQAGHLLVSYYYHSILVIRGHQPIILQTIPLRLYSQLFTQADPALAVAQVNPETLNQHLKTVQQHSLDVIKGIKDVDLYTSLAPCEMTHPVATTKQGALDWNIKHTLWHCGQIALLKRVVHQRYQFY